MEQHNKQAVCSGNTNLKHVYFFIDSAASDNGEENSATSGSSTSVQTRSRTPSPEGNDTDSASFTTASTSRSDMNPLAKEFTPSPKKPSVRSPPQEPSATLLYELCLTTDKGLGLFATSFIKRGTLILAEKPLLKVDGKSIHLVWGPYCRLSNAQKAVYDNLCSFAPPGLNLRHIARVSLVDPFDDSLDKDDIEEMIIEQVRVMSIFSANSYGIPTGGAATYATASRLNHSCVPNVHHSYNPTLKELTVYASRDINAGEELFTSYLGGSATYETTLRRNEKLNQGYGFTCYCPACSDVTGGSDGRRELMAAICWGLNEFNSGRRIPNDFVPKSSELALKQAEDLISLMLAEGIHTVELTKAYREASKQSLSLNDFDLALEYASNEAEVERNCLGPVLGDLKKLGVASECNLKHIYKVMRKHGVEGVPDSPYSGGKNSKNKKEKIHAKNKTDRRKKAKAEAEEALKGGGESISEIDQGVVKQ